jgi:GNAT superfamily N-acetyltransferase
MSLSAPAFLVESVPREQLLRAAEWNHRRWMVRNARAAGGQMHREGELTWIHTPGNESGATILFPSTQADAGEQLDAVLLRCRQLEGLRRVSCWSLMEQTQPPDLGVRLLARGFEQGWQPHWMWLDLRRIVTDFTGPSGLRVARVRGEALRAAGDLPYYSREFASRMLAFGEAHPGRVWHFSASLEGKTVGHSVLNLTTGRLGVAGIFNVGVLPEARGRGIGAAVTLAALRFARELGCRHALLNSTEMGEKTYRRLGFESIGHGQTWWLHEEELRSDPPSEVRVLLAEAVGRGDVDALDFLTGRLEPGTLDRPLPCSMTPVQFAARSGQPASARWLIERGARLDVVSAWDLGWKDRARELLSGSPELANQRSGKARIAPLHEAAFRDDVELARVVLSADPDLGIRDAEFGSTPLGWALHLGRTEIATLIEAHQSRAGP